MEAKFGPPVNLDPGRLSSSPSHGPKARRFVRGSEIRDQTSEPQAGNHGLGRGLPTVNDETTWVWTLALPIFGNGSRGYRLRRACLGPGAQAHPWGREHSTSQRAGRPL